MAEGTEAPPSVKEVFNHFKNYSFVQDVSINHQKNYKRYGVKLKLIPCGCQDVMKKFVCNKCVYTSRTRSLHGVCK